MQDQTVETARWSVAAFAAFWARPNPERVAPVLTPDVLGHWPWSSTPVRGVAEYVNRIAGVIALVPDLRLTVAEHASNGEFTFVRWVMHATGAAGPFELTGIDRLRLCAGLVAENIICFDTVQFHAMVGRKPSWS